MSVITIARGDATHEQVAGALRQALGAGLPPVAVTALMSLRVVPHSLVVALGLAAELVVVDVQGFGPCRPYSTAALVTRS